MPSKQSCLPLLPQTIPDPKTLLCGLNENNARRIIPKGGLIHRLSLCLFTLKSSTLSNSSRKTRDSPQITRVTLLLPILGLRTQAETFRINPYRPPRSAPPSPITACITATLVLGGRGAGGRQCAFIIDVLIRNPHCGPWLAEPPQRAFRAAVPGAGPQ